MYKYDADDESEKKSILKLDANSAHCSNSVADCILIDFDSETSIDSDVIVVNSDTTTFYKDKLTPPVLTHGPVRKRRRCLKNMQLHQDHSLSTDDTTPILCTSRPRSAENNTPIHQTKDSSSDNTTPLVTPPVLTSPVRVFKRRLTKQPRKLFMTDKFIDIKRL